MKKSVKWFAVAGVTLASTVLLVACSGNSKSASSIYSYVYTTEPDTLDYLNTTKATVSETVSQGVDGLLENDKYGNLAPSLAEDWTVSKDGLTYTYKIRKGAKWYTNEGEEYAAVKAQDFVAGLKHAADIKSSALFLVQNSIKGLDAYVKGDDKDFSHVGIKAVDDQTIQYTLNQPESFWNSKTTMGILYPVNEEFLNSKGKDFGKAGDPTSILYNGPFLLKNMTSKSVIEYSKNEHYWDKDKVKIDGIKLSYYDGQDVETLIRGFGDGAYSQARVFPTSSNYASVEKKYKNNLFYTAQSADTAFNYFNVNRQSYSHTAKTTEAQKTSTQKAVQNKDFRQAINFAVDRTAYAAQVNGKEGASHILRTSLVPTNFVQVGDKDFGQIVDEKLPTLGDEWKGVSLADGQDNLHNVDKAKAEFAKAKEALQAEGVEFPIHLDVPVSQNAQDLVQRESSFKQSVEEALGKENVVVDLNMMSEDDYNNVGFFAETPAQKDYDMYGLAWSPDYADPSSYLDIFSPKNGNNLKELGLGEKDTELINKVGLNDYQTLLDDANSEPTDIAKRYEKYAAAQAWLSDSSLILPLYSSGGAPGVQRKVPFVESFALVGNKGKNYYKYVELQKDPVTTKEYESARKKWLEEKAKSNEEYQKDLEKHVK